MFRHEWYKLWHNRTLIIFWLFLLVLNGVFFWYRAEESDVPAHAYRKFTDELQGKSPEEAQKQIASDREAVRAALYGTEWFDTEVAPEKLASPKYCDNLWQENELCAQVYDEYADVTGYSKYLQKVILAAEQKRRLTSLLGSGTSALDDIEKTSRDYAKLDGLTISYTRTRGIGEALSLTSMIFLEMLTAIFFAAVLFAKEKEQGFLRLYSSMYAGRGNMFGARVAAMALAVSISNLLFFLTTILTGCLLYGKPVAGFLSEPLQSLTGYKTAALPVSIGTFLALSYVWTCLVMVLTALLAAVLSICLSGALKVYLILFGGIGVEGVLYLTIGTRDYRSVFRRINLVAFSDAGYSLGQYRNETVFERPYAHWLVALVVILVIGIGLFAAGWILSERGTGTVVRRRFIIRRKTVSGDERLPGGHCSVLAHEIVKFFRYEKVGIVLLLAVLYVLLFTKPYHNYLVSTEQVFYKTYLMRLAEKDPSEYGSVLERFREELAEEQRRIGNTRETGEKKRALERITEYTEYLMTKQGARAVDSRGFELLYADRTKNVILGVAGLLAAILCGTALCSVEYRTGMADLIRISPERGRVLRGKMLILPLTIIAFFGLIYVRYCWQVVHGYGTGGIGWQANSIRDWADVPGWISIGAALAVIYLKRLLGMLLAGFVTVLLARKIKSFLMTAVAAIVVLVVPLLLCLTDIEAVRYLMLNSFFC